jgi:cell division protein FtsB
MLKEEAKKPLSMRPIILLVCFMCLIGLSASVTYSIVHSKYRGQLDNKNQEIQTIQKNNKALTDENIELKNSLQKLEDEYSKQSAQLSEMEALKAGGQTLEQKSSGFEEMSVLKPTWVSSGETTPAFDGNLRIVLYKASDKDESRNDSAAVGYLISDTDKKKLCLRTGKPEDFSYQGKNYLFNLSGIAAQASVYRYCISISLEQ